MSFHKIKSGRVVTISADDFVGQKGTIFYEEDIGDLRLSDGNTVGGTLLAVSLASLVVEGNTTIGNVSGMSGVFTTIGGTLITAYQPNITTVGTLGNLVVTSNINSGNVITSSIYTNSYFYANGQPIKTGSLNVTSNNPPTNPDVGDMWYKTNTDVLYRYSNDGTSSFWLDINGPTGYS